MRFLQAEGDAVGRSSADLQDPPELFVEMIREWEKGFPIVAAIKNSSEENGLMYRVADSILPSRCPPHQC